MSAACDESAIRARADDFARAHSKEIAAKFMGGFSAESNPISIFMAGSPGAGKTETSKMLLRNVGNTARIDADELRAHFARCGYDGTNSHLFQKAASKLVHKIHDLALKKKIGFLLDGTFSDECMARRNIERSLKRARNVFIIFAYQPPQIAWDFVLRREEVEGRRIRAHDFAQKFCASQAVANKMKAEFGKQIALTLIIKSIDSAGARFYQKSIERIDDHIPERYGEREILALIENQSPAN
ncbi:MAG: zeta toxin family protein [Gammaproteobacteria bacterium]